MGKVIDTTYVEDSQYLLKSQTPPNFVADNYYLKEMQDKVDADWKYRPNRKMIEEELNHGSEQYYPVEVVIQSVRSETGEKVSDDWYKVVFKDCRKVRKIGNRYRFSYEFDPTESNEVKNVWIGLNQTTLSPTASQVICRCNGSIGSIYTDENGKNTIHYEPVIQPSKLDSAMFRFNEIAIDPRGQMVLIAQFNKYTEQYYINQRFVIGYDKVYKVNNIMNSEALTTFNSKDIGIIKIYLDQDQSGELDNFETRIAYNGRKDVPVTPESSGDYTLQIVEPNNIPEFLTETGITFKPQVLLGGVPQSGVDVNVSCALSGAYASLASFADYCRFVNNGDGTYSLSRIKENLGLSVTVTCAATVGGKELSLQFTMQLRDF